MRSVGQEGNPSCDEAEPWRSEEQAGFSKASTTQSLREIVVTAFDPGATACEAGGGAMERDRRRGEAAPKPAERGILPFIGAVTNHGGRRE